MLCLALTAIFAVASAQPPVWWTDGDCGVSKYADAGEGCPIGAPCGSLRIIGGLEARENEFPWQASIRDANGHQCGGTVLNERWIASAAACTGGMIPGDVVVVLGAHSFSTPSPSEATYATSAIFEHELYSSSNFENDITLLKTVDNITMNAEVTAICAPDASMMYDDVDAEISGWGTIAGGDSSDILRYTTVRTLMNNTDCQSMFFSNEVTDGMICAGDGAAYDSRDTCQGDAGGQLGLKDASSGAYTAIGLTSWGIGCAAGYPGVYTRVAQYNTWITEKMNKN